MLETTTAVRYVTPLREGGSLPGIVEAEDFGTYVVKFHGAGQGPKVLVAEVIVGELARRPGIPVPEFKTIELDEAIGLREPDPEVQDLLVASAGLNLGGPPRGAAFLAAADRGMSRHAFEYTVLRAVPRVDRGEFVSVGVVLYCQDLDYLAARCHVDPDRLGPGPQRRPRGGGCGPRGHRRRLRGRPGYRPDRRRACGERFRRLAVPRSTVVQAGPVHAGVTDEAGRQLDHLFLRLVR